MGLGSDSYQCRLRHPSRPRRHTLRRLPAFLLGPGQPEHPLEPDVCELLGMRLNAIPFHKRSSALHRASMLPRLLDGSGSRPHLSFHAQTWFVAQPSRTLVQYPACSLAQVWRLRLPRRLRRPVAGLYGRIQHPSGTSLSLDIHGTTLGTRLPRSAKPDAKQRFGRAWFGSLSTTILNAASTRRPLYRRRSIDKLLTEHEMGHLRAELRYGATAAEGQQAFVDRTAQRRQQLFHCQRRIAAGHKSTHHQRRPQLPLSILVATDGSFAPAAGPPDCDTLMPC